MPRGGLQVLTRPFLPHIEGKLSCSSHCFQILNLYLLKFQGHGEAMLSILTCMENTADVDSRAMCMPLSLLEHATDCFSKELVIGEGAYGTVYKGFLPDGEAIAVKILYHAIEIDDEQFKNELACLASIQHRNIVRLVGFCSETEQVLLPYNGRHVLASKMDRALCFEYMHNGSLDRHISDISFGLDWNTCFRIIKGICEGLKYLHEGLTHPLFHLDLKPSNILLDQNMMPKISDFGLSRLVGGGNIKRLGTIAYMAPEFIERQVISHKFDIFSLGVIIMELMTGSKPGCNDVSSDKFGELVLEKWRERLQRTVNGMSAERHYQQVRKCLEIALKCVEYDRHERPSIGEIVNRLNEIETLIPDEVQAVHNPFDSRKSLLFDVHPLELRIPFMLKGIKKPMVSSSCLQQLNNRGDQRITFIDSPNAVTVKDATGSQP